MTYSDHFYDIIRPGCIASAEVIVPELCALVDPRTVIDVGCGEGHFAAAFAELGCEVIGVDGDYVASRVVERFVAHDLSQPFPVSLGRADLVVCLEVAEHLPESRAASFVAELCDLARVVAFSAAIPGQGGAGHVNEQWPDYWWRLFGEHGYSTRDELRWRLWDDDRVEPWYRQNLLLFEPNPSRITTPPPSVVHPIIYDARRQ